MTEFSKNTDKAALVCERYEHSNKLMEGYDRLNLEMDLLAADGVNGNLPLDWDKLLAADDFNFMHDLYGISACMNRSTGKISSFFIPRCAKVEG